MPEQVICGSESIKDLKDPSFSLSQFYRAFNNRDMNLMAENWSHSNTTSLFNPVGGLRTGWKEIKTLYEHIFGEKFNYRLRLTDYSIQKSSEMFVASGNVEGTIEDRNETFTFQVRSTRVYILECNNWKQIHHHSSIIDPSELNEYEFTVIG